MDVGLRRKPKTGVVAGSVWESRMKSGGIKVLNGEEEENSQNCNTDSQGNDDNKSTIEVQMDSKKVNSNMSPKQNVVVGTNGGGKRKTWKSDSLEGSPIQIAKQRSDMVKNPDDKSKESNVSDNGMIKKTPMAIIHNRKTRSMAMKELSLSLDVVEKSPTQSKKTRSQSIKSPPELRKSKSESVKDLDVSLDENANNSPQSSKHCEEKGESCNGLSNGVDERIEKDTISEENWEEKGISSNVVPVKSPPKEDVEDEEIEVEKKSVVVKEISNVAEEQKAKNNLVAKEKNYQHNNQRKPTLPPPILKKQSPSFQSNVSKVHLTSPSKPRPSTNGSHRISTSHSKLQSIVDLVMWRDVSRTAFVFGIGTFFVISSSYTKDCQFLSLISVISYVGLLYLAAIFLFTSFISRGSETNDSNMDYVFGEEEAIRLVKLTLPYVNECLLNLKALFSGDPATTIKMAMMLYVLARCGSSITIWKMAKLSFFGVFTVPKICSSYSKQLTDYGAFWIRGFREGWESCTHKKAVAFAIFTLFWKFSSSIARIWAVFMLFVAFRFYQQSMIEEEEARCEYPSQPGPTQRQPTRPIFVDTGGKQKRIY